MAEIKSINKYLVKRKYKTISGVSYPMDEYQVILYEAESEDCGYIPPQYQWSATTGYLCDYETYTKYAREVKMVSYDSGVTWAAVEPIEERMGEVIAYDSYDCGKPMYRCVTTDQTACVPSEFKLALYDSTNELLFVNDCDSTSAITRSEWENSTTPRSVYKAEIGDCVTSIGDAFSRCFHLSSVTIPNSVTTIGDRAFSSCDSLSSVTIPSGVTSIGNSAFTYCSSLSSVTIPSSVTSIGQYAFYYCRSLTSVTIPSSVTSIGNSAFYNCSGLTSVTIGSGVTTIGGSAFQYCTRLTEITIPNASIGQKSFSNCSSLSSVTIGSGVTSIGGAAFFACHSLSSVTIPSSVISIGNDAFQSCSGLTSVTVEATTPPTLGNYSFGNNTSNYPIYVPASAVNAYKTATNWSDYASRIQAITE